MIVLWRSNPAATINMKIRPYLFSLLALGFALILNLAIGSVFLSPAQLWAALTGHGTQTSDTILWAIRFPRTALSC